MSPNAMLAFCTVTNGTPNPLAPACSINPSCKPVRISPTKIFTKYLVKIFVGEMRTGLHEGLMEQAGAKGFGVPLVTVQKASMALGDIGEVAGIAKTEGKDRLSQIGFQVFRPVKLMLAQTAETVDEALTEHGGRTAFEYKYDGARVQIH